MILRRRPLLLVFLIALVGLCAPAAAVAAFSWQFPLATAFALTALGAGVAGLLCVAVRVGRFRGRLFRLLRHLLAGDYEIGLPPSGRWRDEVSELDHLLDRFLEQLRTYDTLRAQRVRQSQRVLDVALENVVQPMMVYDAEKHELACNPAMQAVLSVSKQTFGLAAIEKVEANGRFVELLRRAAETDKVPEESRVYIQVPPQETGRDIELRVVPIKDKDEEVRTVVLFGTLSQPENVSRSKGEDSAP